NYAQIPHARSSNPPAPLSRQRTKKTKETDKQTRRQREQPRRCSPLISAGRGAPCRAAAAPEPQGSMGAIFSVMRLNSSPCGVHYRERASGHPHRSPTNRDLKDPEGQLS
ncbi:hypothetical protein INR49_025318, partial [Caranx melampygus]